MTTMKFNELKIQKNILRALREAGYEQPTPIQQEAIPPVLAGRDLLGCAQTGTGKTCAFSVPIIQHLCEEEGKPGVVRALILTPTRELALQIYENVCQYARYTTVTAAVIFGGVSQVPQVEAIQRGADILIATPGRLWDLMGQNIVKLNKVECFVLDEADRMLDMGFFPDVKRIIKYLPAKRQTLLFSATIPNEIAALADSLLKKPVRISITPSAKPVEKIEQKVFFVEKPEKRELLADIIRQSNVHQTLVFTRTKHGADRVARDLNRAGIKAKSIHGDKSQNQRQRALNEFKECKIAVLVATDIAARGIDINELPLVINFELPNIPETYVHRIGRTGRAGQEGTAISFCDKSERPYLADIEKLIGKRIPVAGEIPHTEKQAEPVKREPAQRKTTNTRTRRKLVSENAPAEAVAAEAAKEKAAKQKARKAAAAAKRPNRKEKAAEIQAEQHAKAAAPRARRSAVASRGRGRRNDPYARYEKNEPRVDAHTPSRAYALSDEAAERIRKKVEAALAARAEKTAVTAPEPKEKKTAPVRRSRRRAAVVVRVDAQYRAVAVLHVRADVLDLVGVAVRRRELHGVRQVDDRLFLRRRAERLEHAVADPHGVFDLGARKALGRILVAQPHVRILPLQLLRHLADQHRRIDGDRDHAVHIRVEHDTPLQRRRRVVEMQDDVLRAADRLKRPLDQVAARLHEHLHRHVVRNQALLDQIPQRFELRFRGCRKADLDLLEADLHERLEKDDLAVQVHRRDERLVAVAQVDAAPDRRAADHLIRPCALRKADRRKRPVLFISRLHVPSPNRAAQSPKVLSSYCTMTSTLYISISDSRSDAVASKTSGSTCGLYHGIEAK